MKNSNTISIISAYKTLPTSLFESYLKYHSIKIKNGELDDLIILIEHLKSLTKNIEIFDKYFIGYSIPQIGKEFDLLRIDSDTIVNIELKKRSTTFEIEKQLRRNRYYLSFLKKEIYSFTYVSDERQLYGLDENNDLNKLNIRELIGKLASQDVKEIKDIDSFFNPSNYLVSPFNSTQEFIKGKYFLTIHQEQIKKAVLKELETPNYSIISIKGKAGTGKTLLTYDIVKEVYKSKEVLIIHCGILNNGHRILRDTYAWNIISAKNIIHQDFTKYHLIIIDESQRTRKGQLDFLINQIKTNSINCIFSYDGVQTLRSQEIRANISLEIEKKLTLTPFELTTKIRTNKEVARFIKCLFDLNEPIHKMDYSKIELKYFNDFLVAKEYLKQLSTENWKIINYTPDSRRDLPYEKNNLEDNGDNAHTVVGQEFDNVTAVIDKYFYYKNGKLSTQNYKNQPYYHPTKMLFQIVSRTRIKLGVIIINNQNILKRCLDILSKDTST